MAEADSKRAVHRSYLDRLHEAADGTLEGDLERDRSAAAPTGSGTDRVAGGLRDEARPLGPGGQRGGPGNERVDDNRLNLSTGVRLEDTGRLHLETADGMGRRIGESQEVETETGGIRRHRGHAVGEKAPGELHGVGELDGAIAGAPAGVSQGRVGSRCVARGIGESRIIGAGIEQSGVEQPGVDTVRVGGGGVRLFARAIRQSRVERAVGPSARVAAVASVEILGFFAARHGRSRDDEDEGGRTAHEVEDCKVPAISRDCFFTGRPQIPVPARP